MSDTTISEVKADENPKIKETISEVKKTSVAYVKGAMIGGIGLTIWALITRRNVLLWGTIGVIGGGFIAYKVKEAKVKSSNNPIGFKVKEKDGNDQK